MSSLAKVINHSVIPAPLGWRVVVPVYSGENDQGVELRRTPVIAFLIPLCCRRRGTEEGEAFADVIVPIIPTGSVVGEFALQFGDRPPFYTIHDAFANDAALIAYFDNQRRVGRGVGSTSTPFQAEPHSAQWCRWREYNIDTGQSVKFMDDRARDGQSWSTLSEWPPALPPKSATTESERAS